MRRENASAGTGRNSGEKCLVSWCAGCLAGDDYDLAVREVQDTQRLNIRSNREKTYHLVVSFRPEDMARIFTLPLDGHETWLDDELHGI